MNCFTALSQNPSVQSLRIHKSDTTVIIVPLKTIDSITHSIITTATVKFLVAKAVNNSCIKAEAMIISDGFGTIFKAGFCWSLSENPTISSQSINSTVTEGNTFYSNILGLPKNTKYFIRAFVINETGISYSNQVECITLNIVDSLYTEVTIGSQIWSTKNLDITTYRNGEIIRHAKNAQEWIEACNKGEGAWSYFNHDPKNGEIYGKLYNWHAVNDSRGLAPNGYHIPTDKEWTLLTDSLGGYGKDAQKLKSKSSWYSNLNGDNSSGFNAIAGGYCTSNGSFYDLTQTAYWWSSSEYDSVIAWMRRLMCGGLSSERMWYYKSFGFSVRCLRD
jgi:uncharacterized protein (TIGR02145 family)